MFSEKGLIQEPFVAVNVDDYYGKKAFSQLHYWLVSEHADNAR